MKERNQPINRTLISIKGQQHPQREICQRTNDRATG